METLVYNKRKKNIKEYFNSEKYKRKKWLRKARIFHNEDLLVLKELIPENSNVLELGCGNGHLLAGLKPNRGVGLDISENLIKDAKKDYPDLKFYQGDIEKLPEVIKKSVPFDFVLICY